MNDILTGGKRRYHIESVVGSNGDATVYRAFARRRVGQKIKRRYYALFEKDNAAPEADFDRCLMASAMAVPFNVYEEDRFEVDGRRYVVLAKGTAPRKTNLRWKALQNHGYLMLLLAALIFILMIVKFFQSPVDQPIVENDKVVESVEAATE